MIQDWEEIEKTHQQLTDNLWLKDNQVCIKDLRSCYNLRVLDHYSQEEIIAAATKTEEEINNTPI